MYTRETHQKEVNAMLTRNLGIEIEFTGITREKAAKVIAEHLQGSIRREGSNFKVADEDGRSWQIVFDGSLRCQRKVNGEKISAGREYSVELVSPILTYEKDIDTIQEMVRKLRKAGAFTNSTAGIHIHLNGKEHTPRSLTNFVNIIYSRNDLLYTSLEIKSERIKYCKKMDEGLVERMNKKKPKTFKEIEEIWYEGYYEGRSRDYHNSRYHFLNLHSFFNGVGTVELRGFNGTLHAGKIRSFILLSLAMNNQALTQKFASSKKPQIDNPKFAMRTWLNRIGFIGKEFKNPREHLCKHLEGSAAWRFQELA